MTSETYRGWTITRGRTYKSTTGKRGVVYYATNGTLELTSHVSINHVKKMVDIYEAATLDMAFTLDTIKAMSQEGI
jgi:hypothetical protein